MSEFIREVDEDYRHDQIRSLLGRYWIALLALAIVVLMTVGGWRGYSYYRQQQDEAAGSRYFDATQMFAGDRAGSLAALDGLAKNGPAGYRLLARFKAAALVSQTDAAAGANAFDALATDSSVDPDLREIAKLRAAMLLMDSSNAAEIRRRFEPLADANAPFRNVAREMLAVSALQRGDDADAKRWLDAEMADQTASQAERQRADLFLGLIRAGKPGEAAVAPGSALPNGAAATAPAPLQPAAETKPVDASPPPAAPPKP